MTFSPVFYILRMMSRRLFIVTNQLFPALLHVIIIIQAGRGKKESMTEKGEKDGQDLWPSGLRSNFPWFGAQEVFSASLEPVSTTESLGLTSKQFILSHPVHTYLVVNEKSKVG